MAGAVGFCHPRALSDEMVATQNRYAQIIARYCATSAAAAIQALYDAYAAGYMTATETAQYEADVRSGIMVLPTGAMLKAPLALSAPGVALLQ